MTNQPGEAEDQQSEEDLLEESMGESVADRRATSRMCVLTREVHSIDRLIRFVVAPDGVLTPDIRNRLPGRGVWVGATSAAIVEAAKKKLFVRALKVQIRVPDDLAGQVSMLLAKDALQLLSLANKAGALVTGFSKIEGMRGPVLALVQANDGSRAEISRLRGLMASRGLKRTDPAWVGAFSTNELSLSIGREHVIHAALIAHEVSMLFLERARRYVEFQANDPTRQDNASPIGCVCVQGIPRA